MCREEQLLRETVRGMLSEAGFGDVRAAEGRPEPKPGFGDLKAAERDQETRSNWSPPGKWDIWDWVLNGSGTMFDIAGFALNFAPPGPVWAPAADAANALCDVASLSIDLGQLLSAIDAYSSVRSRAETPEVKQMMSKDPAFKTIVESVLRAYEKNRNINITMAIITGAATIASIIELCLKTPADLVGSAPTPAAPPAWLAGIFGRMIGSPATVVEGVLKAIKFFVTLSTTGYQLSTELSELETKTWKDLGAASTTYLKRLDQPASVASMKTAVVALRVIDSIGFDMSDMRGSTIKAYAALDELAVKVGKTNPGFSAKLTSSLPAEMPSIDQLIASLS